MDCPACGLPAEIVDRFLLDGAPHPVEHVKLVCVNRHWFTLPIAASVTSPRSIARRVITYLKDRWDECDHAQRRLLEIRLGVPMR